MAIRFPRVSSLARALFPTFLPTMLGLWISPHALAQQPTPKPATTEEMTTYITMAAINMCTQAELKSPYKAAIDSNVVMVESVISQKHGGKIVGAPADLTREQIANTAGLQTLVRVDSLCGDKIPAEWKKDYDPILTRIKEQIKNSQNQAN